MSPPTTPADYRVLQSVGPFPIRAGDSLGPVVVGLVVGDGLAGLRENADAMKALYDSGYVPGIEESMAEPAVMALALTQLGGNPSRGAVSLQYQVPQEGKVSLVILDACGRRVRTLADCVRKRGVYTTHWDGADNSGRRLPGGVYFVRLEDGDRRLERKVVLLR
jgi:hypothetical protein